MVGFLWEDKSVPLGPFGGSGVRGAEHKQPEECLIAADPEPILGSNTHSRESLLLTVYSLQCRQGERQKHKGYRPIFIFHTSEHDPRRELCPQPLVVVLMLPRQC